MTKITKNWIILTVMVVVTSMCQGLPDKPYCEMIVQYPSYKAFCYDVNTYTDCKTTCRNVVIDQLHKDQDCPWGDAPNAVHCDKINNLTSGLFCLRGDISSLVNKDNLITGMNCCGKCIATTMRTAPDKTASWRGKYKGLYGSFLI